MGFYFKKSFNAGAFRINFSKSGISYSFGVKGARMNISNRGTYVNFGSNGIYYRKKISGTLNETPRFDDNLQYKYTTNEDIHTITSNNVYEITDVDSQSFINELKEKESKISYYKWFGLYPFIIFLALLFFYFFSPTPIKTEQIRESIDYVVPYSLALPNVRQKPDKSSIILGKMEKEAKYKIIDTSSLFYKIEFNGKEGFVAKRLTSKKSDIVLREKSIENPNLNVYSSHTFLFWLILITMIAVFTFLLMHLKKIDRNRLLIEIYYEIDENVKPIYDKFIQHFSELNKCAKVWQYLHSENTNDYKYSSGASKIISRKPFNNFSSNKSPSRIFQTNVSIPYLGLINTELFFFPERLIVKRGQEFGALLYKNIECISTLSRFIEDQGVPKDSIIIGETWRYLNKNGGPDKRFKNNYKIPICEYSEYSFISSTGLNEKNSNFKSRWF